MKIRRSLSKAVVCLHIFPQKKKKELDFQGLTFLSEPLFERLEDRNARTVKQGTLKGIHPKCSKTNICRDF